MNDDSSNSAQHVSTFSPENAQRPPSTNNFKPHESQLSISDSGLTDHGFPYLADSFHYHADRLNVRGSSSQLDDSQLSDMSPSASLEIPQQPMMSTIPRQGGDSTPFKVPSFPSISSITKNSRSTDENNSSLNGIGEASPRLSQFFHPTQESPPQVHSSPRLPENPEPAIFPDPSPLPPKRVNTPLSIIQEREQRKLDEEAAAEAARRKEQEEEDSFHTVPENLRRKWAMEKKAHQIFEELRNIPVNLKSGNSQFDDLLFGTKSRVDPDGVRRVIKPEKTVSENGLDEEETTTSGDSRKRASTAPVKRPSTSTVISNSQPENSAGGSGNDTSHGTVVKETPLGSSPNQRPQSRGVDIESSQFLDQWNGDVNIVTPLRKSKEVIPSSTQSMHRALETPAAKPVQHSEESVPETSPVKEDVAESEEYRTARESFPREEMADSSPLVVPGRRRTNGFVASSIPLEGTQRKRERAPIIHDDVSEEEIPEPSPAEKTVVSPRKRRRIGSVDSSGHAPSVSMANECPEGESHRVFALFKNIKSYYYPATVLEPPVVSTTDQEVPLDTSVLVRFDDGTETTVQLRHVRRMDLQPGDIVKQYLDPAKGSNYTILRCEYDPNEPGNPDINGNNIVVVTEKTRKSTTEEKRFPAEKVYLLPGQFNKLDSRRYLFATLSIQHPVTLPRQVSSSPHVTRPLRPHSTLFRNMIFAISVNKGRETLTKAVRMHNGHVVEDGLDGIFHDPDDVDGQLVIFDEWTSSTFCAVIADGYSRKTKYLQALALGMPCLSSRWIDNCIRQVLIPFMSWQ